MGAGTRKVCAALLAVQIGIPLIQLGTPGPARFGWQMFSKAGGLPSFEVVGRGGEVEVLQVRDLLAVPRQEIDFARELPPILCRRRPEVALVETRPPLRSESSAAFRCQ